MTGASGKQRNLWAAARRLFAGQAFRNRAINVGHLMTGNVMTLFIALGSVALAARSLGPLNYGILALLLSYVQAIERLVDFQAWQPLIRYGAKLDAQTERADLMMLLKYGVLLDLASGWGAWLVAVAFALLGTGVFGWHVGTLDLILIFSSVLALSIKGTPVALLRLAGRFRATAYIQVIGGFARLALSALAFVLKWDLLAFVLIWTGTQIFGNALLNLVAVHELRRRGLIRFPFVSLKGLWDRFPGIWRFSWTSKISLTVWSSAQQFDTLVVGALADPVSAGFYHLAKRLGQLAQQVGAQVQAVVYPELSKLWGDRNFQEFRKVVFQTEALLAAFGVLMILATFLAARPLLHLLAGPQFLPAVPLFIVQVFAVALVVTGAVMRYALLSMGLEMKVLAVAVASTTIFFVTAFFTIPQIGAMGANIAHIALGAIWLGGLAFLFRRGYRERAVLAPASVPPAVPERNEL